METNDITNKNAFDLFSSADWLRSSVIVQRGIFSVASGTFLLSTGQHKGGNRQKGALSQLREGSPAGE